MKVYLRDKEISLLDGKRNGNAACNCNRHSGTLLANYWRNTRRLGEASKMLDAFALGMYVACDQPHGILIIITTVRCQHLGPKVNVRAEPSPERFQYGVLRCCVGALRLFGGSRHSKN